VRVGSFWSDTTRAGETIDDYLAERKRIQEAMVAEKDVSPATAAQMMTVGDGKSATYTIERLVKSTVGDFNGLRDSPSL
jgi:hypothetical protein